MREDAQGQGRPQPSGFLSRSARGAKAVWRWARRHPFAATSIYIAVVSVTFLLLPGLDRAVSALFYSPEEGFAAAGDPFLIRLRHLGPHLVRLVAIASGAVIVAKLLFPLARPVVPLSRPLFLLASLALGPGLVVNAILKDHWGRPRPNAVEYFGGDHPYVRVWQITDHCASNCSFVSGEASSSLWLVSLALIAPLTWRPAVAASALVLCLVLSAMRIAFGGHFLSDTLLSWGITFLLILAVYRVTIERPPVWLQDNVLDRALMTAGLWLRRSAARLTTAASRSGPRDLDKAR